MYKKRSKQAIVATGMKLFSCRWTKKNGQYSVEPGRYAHQRKEWSRVLLEFEANRQVKLYTYSPSPLFSGNPFD